MNDSEEGRYGYSLFERAANILLKKSKEHPALDGLSSDFFDEVDAYLSPKQLHSHPVVACFSKAPNVLSQWRAYAHDAEGFCIGFDAVAIAAMPIMLLEVLYQPDAQLKEVENFLATMFMINRDKQGDFQKNVGKDAALLSSLLLSYKHPSFQEEQEVRALHELRVTIAEDGWSLTDEGGTANGLEVKGQAVQYRAAGTSIIAYVDIPLERIEDCVIRELWLGPRNRNGPGNVWYPLTQHGHRNVALRFADSPYRG